MKSFVFCFLWSWACVSLSLADNKGKTPKYPSLAIGAKAPEWTLKGVDGKMHSLADYADKDVLMLVFTSNHCPDAQASEKKLITLVNDYKDKSFALVAISGNSPEALRLDELRFSIRGDSYEDMIAHAKEYDFNFPYLYDGDDQKITMAYGARSTPHVFIFDKERKLRYKGRVDNSNNETVGDKQEARDAIESLLSGQEVKVPVTRSYGCSTKWLYKKGAVAADNAKWKAKKVEIESLNEEGLKEIVKNDKGVLRLINVWASWCGPCVAEMPELVKIYRMYQHRIDFVTISIDSPKSPQRALDILEDHHVAPGVYTERSARKGGRLNNNFIWHSKDRDALADILDAKWEGPIPHTLLIAPGGEIIYRHSGEINSEDLRRAIINKLGRFWD